MKKIRVLVVDDSFFMRRLITDLLSSSGIVEVVDTAKNGFEAIEKNISLSPDVITLDVEMPKIDGLEALKKIMEMHPVPIIMLSSLTKQGADITIQSLHLGAFDFVAKPSGSVSFDIKKVKNELLDKILMAHNQREKWIIQWNNQNKSIKIEKKQEKIKQYDFPEKREGLLRGLVAIGTSTGGPKALQEVITNIPKNFPYPILIVQHMPAGFTKSLANRLNTLSAIKVVEAENGQAIEASTAYIAPGGYHLTLKRDREDFKINLDQTEPVGGHRPSVDTMFQSLSDIKLQKIFVIMTGMGSDGTKGLKAAKHENDLIIAEDEKTCVVFGMPKSAIQSGLVDVIAPLTEISNHIVEGVQKQRGWQSWK